MARASELIFLYRNLDYKMIANMGTS